MKIGRSEYSVEKKLNAPKPYILETTFIVYGRLELEREKEQQAEAESGLSQVSRSQILHALFHFLSDKSISIKTAITVVVSTSTVIKLCGFR